MLLRSRCFPSSSIVPKRVPEKLPELGPVYTAQCVASSFVTLRSHSTPLKCTFLFVSAVPIRTLALFLLPVML